jgi:lysophospholipase L1-like esterase
VTVRPSGAPLAASAAAIDNVTGVSGVSSAYQFPLGPWKLSNVVASATTVMGIYGSSAADNSIVMERGGVLVGMSVEMQGNIISGTATFQVVVDGVAVTNANSVLVMAATPDPRYGNVIFVTPITYSAKQRVGVQVVSASLNPTTLDPIVYLKCQEQLLGSDALADLVVSGVLDIEAVWTPPAGSGTLTNSFAIWSLATPSGIIALRWDGATADTFTLVINGTDALTTATEAGRWPVQQNWLTGDRVSIRCYIDATSAAIMMGANAAFGARKAVAGAFPLVTPTDADLRDDCVIEIHSSHTEMAADPAVQGVMLGDSISGIVNPTTVSWPSLVYTPTEAEAGKRVAVLSLTGDTLTGQTTKWQASTYRGSASIAWVAIHLGANDVSNSVSAATCASRLQTLVSDIAANNPLAKIIVFQLTPFDNWAQMSAAERTEWITLNADINGTGPNPITGAHRTDTDASNNLNTGLAIGAAGSNTLAAAYDTFADHVHPGNSGRAVAAAALSADLTALGVR